MREEKRGSSAGFTLIELMVTISLAGILAAIAVGPWNDYRERVQQRDTTRNVVSALRFAQVSAVSEGVSYEAEVAADGKSLEVRRLGDTTTLERLVEVDHPKVVLAAASFTSNSSTGPVAIFYPRGSATAGSLEVRREGASKVYGIRVEGLTARVSYDE